MPQLIAALRRARLFIGGDSGPLHLAVALGTPVVGIYGPTDPARNGPYFPADIAIRNAGPADTTHRRGPTISATMLSISGAGTDLDGQEFQPCFWAPVQT